MGILGVGSLKDIAEAIKGPLWLIAGAIAAFLILCGIAVLRCGSG